MQGYGSTDHLPAIYNDLADIEHNMLHFLENHDEQRVASNGFAGSALKGKPAMVVSACLSTSPTMLYFGQHVGEPGDGDMGFGDETRTSIFDYCGVPAHQRWMNDGKFDGGQLTAEEKELNTFYKTLLSFTAQSSALMGEYAEIHSYNRENTTGYTNKLFSFVRWKNDDQLLIISNFEEKPCQFQLKIDSGTIEKLKLKPGSYKLVDKLTGRNDMVLVVNETGIVDVNLSGLESVILEIE
jgi:glycosidase